WPGDTRAEDPEDGELPGSGWPGSKSQILGNKLKSIFKIKGKTNNSGDSTTDEPLDLNVIQSRVGTLTIAVGGVRRGIGVTHHAIQIALYLSKFGNVACCELGNIEEATFWTFNPGKENPFNINNVDFHPCCSNYVNLVYSKKYDFVVLDIGSIKNQTGLMPISQEFVRASQKILISSSSIWDYQDLIKTIELLHLNNYLNGTHILMNFSNEKVFEDIQESLNIKQQDHFGIQLHKSTLRPDLFKDWDSELYRQIFGG
ncbi:MinD/ParA family ATP-binding protein, partial [Paenibacillus macquariensis]